MYPYRRMWTDYHCNEQLASCSDAEERVFWAIYSAPASITDDLGRFPWDPKLIQLGAIPNRKGMTVRKVLRCLEGLAAKKPRPLLRQYQVDGKKYGEIVKFRKRNPDVHGWRRSTTWPEPLNTNQQVSTGLNNTQRESTSVNGCPLIEIEIEKGPPIPPLEGGTDFINAGMSVIAGRTNKRWSRNAKRQWRSAFSTAAPLAFEQTCSSWAAKHDQLPTIKQFREHARNFGKDLFPRD